jgi:threonine synthase
MKYYSLNHNAPKVSFQEAVIQGLALIKDCIFRNRLRNYLRPFDYYRKFNEEIALKQLNNL